MTKKRSAPLEELPYEQLLKKCYNQKRVIQELNDKVKLLSSRNRVLETMTSEKSLTHKLLVCMEETLSYIDDVTDLRKENQRLKGEL